MNIEKIDEAEAEAKRFLKKIRALKIRAKTDSRVFFGCAETAAVRRSSMDLSRSLSKLRKYE